MIYTDGHLVDVVRKEEKAALFGEVLQPAFTTFKATKGYTLLMKDGKTKRIDYEKPFLTNNEAELYALIHAATFADIGEEIRSDSQTALSYATKYKMGKNGATCLNDVQDRLILLGSLLRSLVVDKQLTTQWVPRGSNPIT